MIDAERFLDDLRTLRTFGATGTGVVRPSFSDVDMAARRWLHGRYADAGLDASIDGIGNVFGRSPNPGPALLIGSHSDTQPTGGWLDGAYGVIVGLEVARAIRENPDTADLAVDAVAWVDEESTYVSCLGSRSFCGLVDPVELEGAASPDGHSLADALAGADLSGEPDRWSDREYAGFLEAHIEQGPALEASGDLLGVVTAIVGARTLILRFAGQQNHAGTTPMRLRRDAGRAAIHFGHAIDQRFGELTGDRTVWTIGDIRFEPGASSIIPGRAELTLQFRDPDGDLLERFEQEVRRIATDIADATAVDITIEPDGRAIEPAAMDQRLHDALAAAAEAEAPGHWTSMPSAAVHDAMFLADRMPAGMLFVPSIGGISHDFAEDTTDDDLVRGVRTMAAAAVELAQRSMGSGLT